MSLVTQVSSMATRIGTEFKTVYARIGTLGSLSTTDKTSTVAAINEVVGSVATKLPTASYTAADVLTKIKTVDGATSGLDADLLDGNEAAAFALTGHTHSGTYQPLDADLTAIAALAGTSGNLKKTAADTWALDTTAYAALASPALTGNPTAPTQTAGDNSTRIATTAYADASATVAANAAAAALVASAPGALNTLDELAAALGDDASFSTTITTALGNRLRFDAVQTLTAPQQAQGIANLGVTSAADIGSVATNFVTVFEAALV